MNDMEKISLGKMCLKNGETLKLEHLRTFSNFERITTQ